MGEQNYIFPVTMNQYNIKIKVMFWKRNALFFASYVLVGKNLSTIKKFQGRGARRFSALRSTVN